MGRLFLIDYDQTPDKMFYSCRSCRTHIALKKYLLSRSFTTGNFEKAVNLLIDDPVHYRRDRSNRTVADVFCVKCNRLLGREYVKVVKPNIVIREGRIRMDL